jgi:hypothetical protein
MGIIKKLMISAVVPLVVALASCTRPESVVQESAGSVLFNIRIALSGNDSFATPSMAEEGGGAGTRAGEELPVNDMEKLHTLRIIILDGEGKVEVNEIWDLTQAPAIGASGEPFKVKGGDRKTVIFVGNEANTVIRTPGGTECTVSEYFSRLYVGLDEAAVTADMDEIRGLILPRDKNSFFGSNTKVPIPINAIYDNIEIPNTSEVVSRDFWLHRAVAKYTFRIKYDYSDMEVSDLEKVRGHVESVTVSNVADRQYYFPVAQFGNSFSQYPLQSYTAPSTAESATQTVGIDKYVALKSTLTITPYYVPEGPVLEAAADPYWVKARINGRDSDRKDILYGNVENPAVPSPMRDLPRNHHVVVDGTFNDAPDSDFTINISVCKWNEQTIDIPAYN